MILIYKDNQIPPQCQERICRPFRKSAHLWAVICEQIVLVLDLNVLRANLSPNFL